MSNIYELPKQDQRFDEASDWLAKLDRELKPSEKTELQQWMAADGENLRLLLEMARLWDDMTILSQLSDLFPETLSRQEKKSSRFAMAIAASLMIAILTGVLIVNSALFENTTENTNTVADIKWDAVYETAIGEQSTVMLVDGSEVILNTNSLLKVHYAEQHRLLQLEYGEVHVEVAHDPDRPLSVLAAGKVVQALGTAFSVEITQKQHIELVVTDGKVLVGIDKREQRTNKLAPARLSASASILVAEGEEFVLGDTVTDEEIVEVSPEEIEIKLSWRQGKLIFRGESLEDAVTEIGRYTTIEFIILDDDLKKVRIAGLFRAGDVDGLLLTLKENFNISNQRTDDGKILLTRLSSTQSY